MKLSIFTTKLFDGEIKLLQSSNIMFTKRKRYRIYSYAKAGFSIAKKNLKRERKIKGSETHIINEIHTDRFNDQNQYVITGGHFHQLFVRNLGIFYNALLDSRIESSEEDWIRRQSIALRTVALDLEVFSLANRDYTTIVPLRNNNFTALNIYARPSDSLFSILYTLCSLSNETFILERFPAKKTKKTKYLLQTKSSAFELLDTYKDTLRILLEMYMRDVIDADSGFIKKSLMLSSARDGIKRSSSFYDNVIAWATMNLAKKLNLYAISDKKLSMWKAQIIDTFWDEHEGIFIDDLSEFSARVKLFSADSFIVISSGFFDIKNTMDKHYLTRMIQYVKTHDLDKPFPLHYSTIDLTKNLYRPVKYFAKSYMGRSIWSHWGMEYVKALILLSNDRIEYLSDAQQHIESYKKNIEKYGGYPELYKPDGTIFSSRIYKSVLRNGWVINYEQAKMMIDL